MATNADSAVSVAYSSSSNQNNLSYANHLNSLFRRVRQSMPFISRKSSSQQDGPTHPSSTIDYGALHNNNNNDEFQSLPELVERNQQQQQQNLLAAKRMQLENGPNGGASSDAEPPSGNVIAPRSPSEQKKRSAAHDYQFLARDSYATPTQQTKSVTILSEQPPPPMTTMTNESSYEYYLNNSSTAAAQHSTTNTPGTPFRTSEFERHYEELLRGSVPCPSCMGTGRIPKEREGELVALIPVKDNRLKPRRTVLYVSLAILICAVLGGLFAFVLLPRTVQLGVIQRRIYPYAVKPVQCSPDNQTCYTVFLHGEVNITNWNYFPISINSASAAVSLDNQQLAQNTNDTNEMVVPARTTTATTVPLNFTLQGNFAQIYSIFCIDGPENMPETPLHLQFLYTVSSSYLLAHSETDSVTIFQFLGCSMPAPTNIVTTTTTTRPPVTLSHHP